MRSRKFIFLSLGCAGTLLLLAVGCNHSSFPNQPASSGASQVERLPYDVEFQNVIKTASNKVFPAVVYIKAIIPDLESGKNASKHVGGSGVLISPEGEIITNFHVVGKATSIRCLLNDGQAFEAEVVGSDQSVDLALIKLKRPADDRKLLPYAEFSERTIQTSDFVMAMGAPWGFNRSVSVGIISCPNRYVPENSEYTLWFQTDAAISPGNSGGPLVDINGRIVGINTMGIGSMGSVGFTLPSPTIEKLLPRFREYGKANWAWFGIKLQPLIDFNLDIRFDYPSGVVVADIDAASPAEEAGLEPKDLILAINGKSITAKGAEDLPAINRMLGLMQFNQPVTFQIQRNGKIMELKITPTEKGKVEGDEFSCERWNMTVKSINRFQNPTLYFYQQKGVYVYGISHPGNAGESGLSENDIIVSIGGVKIDSMKTLHREYDKIINNIAKSNRVVVTVMRNGNLKTLVLNFAKDYNKE
ncbi:MAG: trypsin-like peptidase domain-containing protein [Lentisphaeria bacterium]|nr:trypsin-like peptidase domain-containing protein [Lentisphaeria bacterium]